MASEMISANVGILPRQNELLTKNTRFSVKMKVDFGSEFGTNKEKTYIFYVGSKSFAQQIWHRFSNFFRHFPRFSCFPPSFSRISRRFPRFSRTETKFRRTFSKSGGKKNLISWDIIRKKSLKITRTTCCFITNDVLFRENEGIPYKVV